MNEVGRCSVSFSRPLALDPYRRNRTTGSVVLVDRLTSATVGVGIGVVEDRRVASVVLHPEFEPDCLYAVVCTAWGVW